MALRTDCQQDRSTDVRGAGGTRDYLASTYRPVEANGSWAHSWGHWHRHCLGQPTRSGQHTTSANPTECSTQSGWYSSRDSRGRSTGDGSCSHTYTSQPSWSDSSQSYGLWAAVPSESGQGTTETRPLNSFSVFLCFLFFLETTGYRTLSVDLVVSLRLYLRLSYKLGTDHFCVEIMLWSPCAFTIYSNYMHTQRLNLTCCSEPPCFSGVSSEFSSVHDSLWCSCCSNLSLKLDLLRSKFARSKAMAWHQFSSNHHQGFFSKNTLWSDAYLQHVLLDNMPNHNNSYYANILQTVIHKLSFYTN